MRLSSIPKPRLALILLTFWTAMGLLFALPKLATSGIGGDWHNVLFASLAEWWTWGLIALVVPWLDGRLPFPHALSVQRIAAHLAAGVIATGCFMPLYTLLAASLGAADWHRILDGQLLADAERGMYLWELLVYCLITGAWLTYRYHQRSVDAELALARLERDYADARLNTLRMQLDPHFLFNTLNTISAHVQTEPKQARQMIGHLGELLRHTLEPGYRQWVPLAEELDFLEHYLSIQRIRFSDRITIDVQVTPEARNALVPSLVLQPVVENAFRHGFADRADAGHIEICAERRDELLLIRIMDNGVGLPQGWNLSVHAGLGLAVTRERIETAGPHGSGILSLGNKLPGGTEVKISLPFCTPKDLHITYDHAIP